MNPRHLALLTILLAGSFVAAHAADCNNNAIEDACDLDCGVPAGPCDVPGCGLEADCDADLVPDSCELAEAVAGCNFSTRLLDNGTTTVDDDFLGPPDDVWFGIGGQVVTWEVGCGAIVDRLGPDLTLYEADTGGAEFSAVDVLVSLDGINFFSVKSSETATVDVPGDGAHGSSNFARSYDIVVSGLSSARFVRVDGAGTGASGPSNGFDLDAVGFVNVLTSDCDASGTLDACEMLQDCNGNTIPESCELADGVVLDCDASGTADTCDTLGGVDDCDGDTIPDSCESDCNANLVPDDCDIAGATSDDCNGNDVPDECDLLATSVTVDGYLFGLGGSFVPSFVETAPFPAAGPVDLTVDALGDFGASNEYLDVLVNGAALARVFEVGANQCAGTVEMGTIAADAYNVAVAGGDATIALDASSSVNVFECFPPEGTVSLTYAPIVDCNTNGVLDQCDIAGATSTDVNLNGIADDCEVDCNGNATPDDYDLAQGISLDCNGNLIPDECDVVTVSDDCNANIIPDECETDCNGNMVPDDCDIASSTSSDCDTNAIPDECDLAGGGCSYADVVVNNGTTGPDERFLGVPDGVYWGLGGQIVTLRFDCGFVTNGPGPDLNVYEVSTGSAEFNSLEDVRVSADGVTWFSVKATEAPVVRIPGDNAAHTNDNFARSYDIFATGLNAVRFVQLDGAGTGGGTTEGGGFDLDAIGAIHSTDIDCDASGTIDRCETFTDCNANGLKDSCEIALGLTGDCDGNMTLDSCDVAGGAPDVDADFIPDGCEPDCNTNSVPDHYDIEQGTSIDCNDNIVPDECDLGSGGSLDCNNDSVPDECPVCPTVEVTFIVDTSSSMTDEGTVLCAKLVDIVAELQADLVNVDTEILGILGTAFGCLTDTVGNLYGTAVPGNPPAGQEILGDPCGANLNEDWGLATSIVAGLKPWQADSVRLIVPISDEGPRCGNPVTDPGSDRDAINHAIGQARANDVIVSPIAGTGSSGALLAIMDVIAQATGGQVFSSTEPDADLADGISGIIGDACLSRSDCNGNTIPDDCDLVDMTSNDCNMSGVPDECEDDCNGNGLADSCDIAAMTSDDANTNGVPDECEGIVLTGDGADWNWTPIPSAIGYDLVRGTLSALQAAAGDFASATDECTVNDHAGTSWPDGPAPSAGEAYWYLVRGEIGAVDLSWDSQGTGQAASRDAGILASGVACP